MKAFKEEEKKLFYVFVERLPLLETNTSLKFSNFIGQW